MSADMTMQDDLAAGRDLDAEVATHVFGWCDCKWDGWSWLGTLPDGTERWPIPAYSTDMGAAWTVLDEMVWRVGTANIRLDMEDYGRGAGTSPTGAERAVWVTIGEHTEFGPAPLAICRAALRAVSEALMTLEDEILAALREIDPDVWKALRVESMQRGVSVARLIEQWQRRDCAQHPYFSGGCPCDCHVPANQTVTDDTAPSALKAVSG